MNVKFSNEAMREYQELISRYPEKKAALLMVAHLAQREFGWISRDVMEYIGELIEIPFSEVYDTITFYTMFKRKPMGKYHLQVCRTLSCKLTGAGDIFHHLEEKLGIKDGEVTLDGKFSLLKVECLGSCGTGPVVQINDDYHENLSIERLDKILSELK